MFEQKLPKYMTQEEVKTFFSKIKNKRDRALFATIYYYGLRVTEATLLNLNDIDFNRNKILVRRVKGGVWGEKPLLRNTKRLIKAYLGERTPNSGALFTGKQGKLKRRRIEQLFKYYAKKAKLKSVYSVHCLRHSIATHLLDDGQSIEFVQDHLGHKNIQNTQIYSKISERKRKEVFDQLEYSRDIVRL